MTVTIRLKPIKSIYTLFSMSILIGLGRVFTACNEQNQKTVQGTSAPEVILSIGDTVSELGKDIDCIFQDKDSIFWFASNGEGVYRYDGKTILHIAEKDNLCSPFVWAIQQDVKGNIWFTTRDGVCRFDGKQIKNYSDSITKAPYGTLNYKPGGLFFNHLNGVCFYDGTSFTNFVIHPPTYIPELSNLYRPYGVYCTLADSSGRVWFGTQEKGVYVYDGKIGSFIDGKDLAGPAVRSIFQDKGGILWFGNNGGGLYRYDGKSLRNITEERGLGNFEFLRERKLVDKKGTLARVFAINEDSHGLWIGTVDSGVWKYDGKNLKNYTMDDGLSGNSVPLIYKDRQGVLWFVSNGDSMYHFDGQTFLKVVL